MNKRIKELAEQATRKYDRLGNEILFAQPDLEQFAELIVAECTALVQKYMTRWPEDHELTKQIKEHFGVEE